MPNSYFWPKLRKYMDKNAIFKLVKEEVTKMISEAKEKAPKYEKELEALRKKMEKAMVSVESVGDEALGGKERKMKRVAIQTVADILDCPVSELMLYLLNNVKGSNERKLVEYRLGHVYFYAE